MSSRKLALKLSLKLVLELKERGEYLPDDKQRDLIDEIFQFRHTAELCEVSRHG